MSEVAKGYRTLIVALLLFAAPALAKWGFKVDADTIADALIIVGPSAMAYMRLITTTPMGHTPLTKKRKRRKAPQRPPAESAEWQDKEYRQ